METMDTKGTEGYKDLKVMHDCKDNSIINFCCPLLIAGAPGRNGVPGQPGPPGPQGVAGRKGDRGPQGLKGSTGPSGGKGDRGPQGPQGPTGPKGNRGSTGAKGSRGSSGGPGPTGPRGSTGQKGSAGFGGSKGQKGERGLCPQSDCGACDFPCYARRKRDTNEQNAESDISGVVYTMWGNSACPLNSSKVIYSGEMAIVGKSSYICLPQQTGNEFKDAHMRGEGDKSTTMHRSQLPCSTCLGPQRNTMLMIPSESTCPPNWTREYYGYIMSTSIAENGQFICVDKSSTVNLENNSSLMGAGLYYVKVNCPSNMCGNRLICTVCTL